MVDFLLFLTYSEIMGLWAFSHTFPSAKKALSLQLLIAVPHHSGLCTDITSSEKDVPKLFLYPPSLTLLNFLHNIFFLIFLFLFGCIGSLFLCDGFLQLRQVGATLHRGARASHYHGLSCCGAQAPDTQAQ